MEQIFIEKPSVSLSESSRSEMFGSYSENGCKIWLSAYPKSETGFELRELSANFILLIMKLKTILDQRIFGLV